MFNGRDIQSNKRNSTAKTAGELKYNDYFDPPDGEKQEIKSDDGVSEEDDDDDMDDDNMDDDDDESMDDQNKEMMDDGIEDEDEENNNKQSLSKHEKEKLKVYLVLLFSEERSETSKSYLIIIVVVHFLFLVQMEKKIAHLEKENLTTKPWQMSGEAGGTARPFNSLLQEDLNFDHTTAVG